MAQRMQIGGARTLLTGASGGLGGVLARRFASEGAELVLSGRQQTILDALAAAVGGEVITADLSEPAELERLITAAGQVDILIANAALPGSGRLATLEPVHIDRALAVTLRAPIMLAHAFAPQMVERGSGQIVFIGSLSGRAANAGSSIYNATKFGLRGFALALRAELASSGVGVALIEPGFIRATGMFGDAGVKLPPYVGTVRPERVADAVISAIRHNRGEVVVAPLALRAGASISLLAPEFAARGARLLGGERVARRFEEAQENKR
jgi:short-subunit dehydrogenase